MSSRVRWLIFLALVGVVAGASRGQAGLTLVNVGVLLWILWEWLRFQLRIRVELPQLKFERLVNQRSEARGTLWAGRRVEILLRVVSEANRSLDAATDGRTRMGGLILRLVSMSPMERNAIRGNVIIRDVVPELFELPHTANPLPEVRAPRRFSFIANMLLSPFRACVRFFALDSEVRTSSNLPANQWRLHSSETRREFAYEVVTRGVGRAKLPGVRLTLSDPYGFFQFRHFVRVEQSFRVLSDYFQKGDIHPTVKRFNSLPSHGIHRLHRSGVSSELLELREYVPGDPPKSIAWKASARRDMLMTRQYESEVPVRTQFFVDGSLSTRIGGFGLRLLDQASYVTASVAKAAISVGDPVSAQLIDESGVKRLPWFVGDLGFLQMLTAFADFADRAPPLAMQLTPTMLSFAYGVCHERYPDMMERKYHPVPFTFFSSKREKFRLIGALGQLFQLSARDQAECYGDDARLAFYVQRLLHEAGMPWMSPLFAGDFDFDVSAARTVHALTQAMSRSIAVAKDNEVLVVLADAQTCAGRLDKLLPVVRLALAKHHRVVFICPTMTFSRPTVTASRPRSNSVRDLLIVAEQAKSRELKELLQRELVRLGVAVTYSADRNAIRMVLAEMDMARAGRRRTHGVRA